MSFNIDVAVMINDYHNLMGGGSKSSTIVIQVVFAMTAMAPKFIYIMNRKLQPDSNGLRIHIPSVIKASHTSMMAQSQ